MQSTPRSEHESQASTPGRAPVGTPRLQNSFRLSAEAMLSGSPARAAYRRARTSDASPLQLRPELMPPAGIPWTDLKAPRRPQNVQLSEVFAKQQADGARQLSEASLFGSRSTGYVPKPLPAGPSEVVQKLGVTIISARGLRNADNPKVMAEGFSDPYCSCEIPGKPHSKIKTSVVRDTLDPVWEHTADVVDFAEGDSLRFNVYDFDQGQEFGELLGTVCLQSSQFYPMGFEGELPLAEAGEGIHAFLRIFIPDIREREAELNMYGGVFPEDALTAKYVRKFMLCARRLGARGLPRLAEILKAAAAGDGTFDEQSFEQVAMAEGLCSVHTGCSRIFHHLKTIGGGIVRVEVILKSARGIMQGRRLQSVREIWKGLDPAGRGYIEVADLMTAFDPRRLPSVQYDGVSIDMARREYLEGLGACRFTVDSKQNAFALDEAIAGRRPLPVGEPAHDVRVPRHLKAQVVGAAVMAPAGKEGPSCQTPRSHRDFLEEVNSRPSRVLTDSRISAAQFEDFYTALSHGITDDRLFERTLRDPWTCSEVHEKSQAARYNMSPGKKTSPKAPNFRLSATFEDGSKRVVLLSNIDGISEQIGHAGVHCSQMWTWGPEVKAEIIRRLEADGVSGVCQVKPIPS